MGLFKVLIVENEEAKDNLLQDFLLRNAYAIIGIVSTAEEAVSIVNTNKPDIVIVDIDLQGEQDAIKLVRRINKDHDIPVIYIVGHTAVNILKKAKNTQPIGYFIKPFTTLQLETTMDMVVKKMGADKTIENYQQHLEQLVIDRTRELLVEVKMHKDERQYAIENEIKLSTITNAANDAIILFDDLGRITFWNMAAERMFKYPKEDILNQNIRVLFSSDNNNSDFTRGLEVIQGIIDDRNTKDKIELIATRADGIELSVEMSVATVDIEGDSNVVCIVRDISRRIAYLNEISRFKLIADLANYGLAITDADGNFIYVNKYFTGLIEYSNEDILGESFFKITPNYKKRDIIKYVTEASNISGGEGYEMLFVSKSKVEIPILINSVIIRDNHDEPEFYAVSVIDIRERKEYEENILRAKKTAEESDKMKTAFLSTISHELRTPLNAIIGFSELMRTSELDSEDIKDFNNEIYKSGNFLLSIVEDILDVSMLESKSLKLIPKQFSLNNLMNKLYDKFKNNNRYPNNDITLKWVGNLEKGQDDFVTDMSKLEQVFVKLLDNAYKFSLKGTIEFGYICHHKYEDISFFVKDQGVGIKDSKLNEIFECFKQVDDGKTTAHNGLGLGLSIVIKLIELMDGEIDIISKPKKGTEFVFNINMKGKAHQTMNKSLILHNN